MSFFVLVESRQAVCQRRGALLLVLVDKYEPLPQGTTPIMAHYVGLDRVALTLGS